jgi:phage protein D
MPKLHSSTLAAVVLSAAVFVTLQAAPADPGRLVATIGGVVVAGASIVVDSDAMQPDTATVTIERGRPPFPNNGTSLSVDLEGVQGAGNIFKGEVVGIEPVWNVSGSQRIIIRAFNKMHRLSRARKTRVFEKMTDSEIASRIAEENELGFGRDFMAEASQPQDRVFQHNQTDLEFLRARAARIGYQAWVDDSTLYFQRDGVKESVSLGLGCTAKPGVVGLRTFHPRLSSASTVSKVTVRGWDPKKKEEIIGEASRRIIPLSDAAARLLSPPGQSLDLGSTFALDTEGGAYGAANGALSALTAQDISAEVVTDPTAALRARIMVVVDGSGSRFDSKYYVTGARHTFRPGAKDGLLSFARLVRDDRGMYVLPELGDEVLVAFEHGDMAHPVVVGSLWSDTGTPHEPACGNKPRPSTCLECPRGTPQD